MSGSYDAEDGYSICAHIDDFDLQEGTISKEDWLKESYAAKISYTDEYNYLKDMTFEVCNNLKED